MKVLLLALAVLAGASTPPARDAVYGDVPLNVFAAHGSTYPWTSLRAAAADIKRGNLRAATPLLQRVAGDAALGSRLHLEAENALRQAGVQASPHANVTLEGVVLEVVQPAGRDTLAVYADKSAIYVDQYERSMAIAPGAALEPQIDAVLAAGRAAQRRIGPWPGPRPPLPVPGLARLSLLSARGLAFGSGPPSALSRDAISGPVFKAAAVLIRGMAARSRNR